MSDLELVPQSMKVKQSRGNAQRTRVTKSSGADHFQTPPEAIEYLLPFIPKFCCVWDPACGNGNIVEAFHHHERQAYGSDILKHCDFLSRCNFRPSNLNPMLPFEVIVTNPPYSIKDQWIAECYRRGDPFALLMPLTALEGRARQSCYKQHGLQLMVLPRRINFETPNNAGSSSWFATAWFTWKLNLPSDLYFAPELEIK